MKPARAITRSLTKWAAVRQRAESMSEGKIIDSFGGARRLAGFVGIAAALVAFESLFESPDRLHVL